MLGVFCYVLAVNIIRLGDMTNHDYWMRYALWQANLAQKIDEVPIGAVLVIKNQLIAASYNNPISAIDPSAHAEINCLRLAAKRLGNYRLSNNPSVLYCTLEPCLMCLGAIIHARVGTVVCGARDAKTSMLDNLKNLKNLNHIPEIITNVYQQQCQQLLLDFFKNKRT